MKPPTILAALLPALTLAGPVKTAVAQQPVPIIDPFIFKPIPVDPIPGNFKRSTDLRAELDKLDDLITCLRNHKDFEEDFSQADSGIFSITNVEPTCCHKAEELYHVLPIGQYGTAVFEFPCKGVVISGVNQKYMKILRNFFEKIDEGNVDGEK